MMRLRLPNGITNADSMRFYADSVEPYGPELGIVDITTRQNIQLRGVVLEVLAARRAPHRERAVAWPAAQRPAWRTTRAKRAREPRVPPRGLPRGRERGIGARWARHILLDSRHSIALCPDTPCACRGAGRGRYH
eukprot:7037793-Prymnesium_polylepis.1